MAAVYIKRSLGAFALAWVALCLSGWGAMQRLTGEVVSKPAPETELVTVAAPSASAVGEVAVTLQPLVLQSINGRDTEVLVPQRDDGGFDAEELQRAAVAFSQQSPKVHALAPRLLDLVYRAMRHFGASVVHVVSGYRRDRAGSRHSQGRAVDMNIEGVANDRLAAYLRDLGFVGVGFYPRAGFVHLDVRDASYFWIDDSEPGAPNHLRQVHEEQARAADAAARARGEVPDVFVPNNRREDAAAAKVYARRAKARREAGGHE
jgi:uncharacterized protein YcbK (DUF882 family)